MNKIIGMISYFLFEIDTERKCDPRNLGSKIQYWIINWIIFFVKIQWIFGRSKVKRGRKRVKGVKYTLLDFTGFLKK